MPAGNASPTQQKNHDVTPTLVSGPMGSEVGRKPAAGSVDVSSNQPPMWGGQSSPAQGAVPWWRK